MNQVSPDLRNALALLLNHDVKMKCFLQDNKPQKIVVSLILLFVLIPALDFLCACTLSECSPITVKQLVLLLHTFSVYHKYLAFYTLCMPNDSALLKERHSRKLIVHIWKSKSQIIKKHSPHHCEG